MYFYIKKGNVQPIPSTLGLYTEVVRLEKLFIQQTPYPNSVFDVIYKRAKTCEEWLWVFGDQDTSSTIRHKLEIFQRDVQNKNTIVDGRVFGNAELALFMDKQKAKIAKAKE